MIARFHSGEPDDAIDLIGVDKEVLSQRFIRMQTKSGKKLSRALCAMVAVLGAQSRWRPHVGQGRTPSSSKSLFAILS